MRIVIVGIGKVGRALAEHLSGSEEAFVARMNQRAAQLGADAVVARLGLSRK